MYSALQLAVGTLYSFVIHPRLTKPQDDLKTLKPAYDLVGLSIADMIASLVVVYFSGGWGSPFWYFALTSILVPCFLLSPVWAMVTVAGYVGAYVIVVILSGSLQTALVPGQRNLFLGSLATAFLVAIAVSYLGTLFHALQAQRLRTKQALDETETLFRVAENVVQAGTDLDQVLGRMSQVVRTSGLFDVYAVLLREGNGELTLAASSVGVEELDRHLVDRVADERRSVTQDNTSNRGWHSAVPLISGEDLIGVMVAGVRKDQRGSEESPHLVEAIASQVAIGIQNAYLARQKAELAAQKERSRIAREIHDGIAQSIYMLSLHLETCAELAQQQRQNLRERLDTLVALSKQTLLEVRHYIFDLKPYLAGEKGVSAMVENQVKEFNKVSGIATTVQTRGEERSVSVGVATCLYRITQEALGNVFKHAQASRVDVILEFVPELVRLTVQDNGRGFDTSAADSGHGLSNMRQRAGELEGAFSLGSSPGAGTKIVVELPC